MQTNLNGPKISTKCVFFSIWGEMLLREFSCIMNLTDSNDMLQTIIISIDDIFYCTLPNIYTHEELGFKLQKNQANQRPPGSSRTSQKVNSILSTANPIPLIIKPLMCRFSLM